MLTTSAIDASALRVAIARVARRLRQEDDADLSPSVTAALGTLARHGPLTPTELAAREGIKRPTVARLVARLEERGLVTRTPDAEDRRSYLLALTPQGSRTLAHVRSRRDAFLAERLSELSEDDRAVLGRAVMLLEHVVGADSDGSA
jgi:DNA-binding MarR family transcriptional regulator